MQTQKDTTIYLYFGAKAEIKHNQSEIIITDKDGKTTLSFGDIMDLYSLIHRSNENKESI